jgi:hypothetical protein
MFLVGQTYYDDRTIVTINRKKKMARRKTYTNLRKTRRFQLEPRIAEAIDEYAAKHNLTSGQVIALAVKCLNKVANDSGLVSFEIL